MNAQFPIIAAALSLLACYGTLIVIAMLVGFGLAITLNETIWAGAIVGFAALAVLGLSATRKRHGRGWPLGLGVIGFCVLCYVMFVNYARVTEIIGFAALLIAVIADRKLRGFVDQ